MAATGARSHAALKVLDAQRDPCAPGSLCANPAGYAGGLVHLLGRHGTTGRATAAGAGTAGRRSEKTRAAATKPADHHRQPVSPWV